MPESDDIPVLLPRESWERILEALRSASKPTPLCNRLKVAIDQALTKRINESIDRFMQASEGN